MRKQILLILPLAILCTLFCSGEKTGNQRNFLWPEVDPFSTGYLEVSELHQLYYELCGNPDGKPVFVLHGGPGGRISPYYRRFFNPEVYLIVLHDQRGAGKSKPKYELEDNTTWHLVEDIESLRNHLKLDKILLFGGSWGSTLALAYAETHPENVSGMVLRGIFTATRSEIDHFYGGGTEVFFPDVYARLKDAFGTTPTPKLILDKVKSDDPEERKKYGLAWTVYEIKLAELAVSDRRIEGMMKSPGFMEEAVALALIENHYMANGCFFEEGQLLRDAEKIKDIPAVFVNGRYDMICPPINAYRLQKKLSNCRLEIVEAAGHWMGDRNMERALLRAVSEFE